MHRIVRAVHRSNMLKEFWYACELSSRLTDKPRKVRLLGRDLVLYRQGGRAGGGAVALDDRCVHRGGSLSGGRVDGECVRCPYHGWKFDPAGACVQIPAHPAGAPIPIAARVASLPVEERSGFIWVYPGTRPAAERPPIPAFPEFGQPGWRAIDGEFDWKASYVRVVENGLDFAHGPFVHATSFGNPDEPEVDEYQVESDGLGGRAALDIPASKPSGLWGVFQRNKRPRVPVALQFHMPNLVRIDLRPLPSWRLIIFDTNIPVDETHTRTLYITLRNFFTGAWADGDARKRTLAIFEEDRPVVEGIRPILPGADVHGDVPVKSDRLPLLYRTLRKKALANE